MSTLFDKIWATHAVSRNDAGEDLVYIDRHLVHEVSSPQAFAGLAAAGRRLREPLRHVAIQDHNVPTSADRLTHIPNAESAAQIALLRSNAHDFGVPLIDLDDPRQGIVHVVGARAGPHVLPGMHRGLRRFPHSPRWARWGPLPTASAPREAEHVMSTPVPAPAQVHAPWASSCDGSLPPGVTAKDLRAVRHRPDRHQRRRGPCHRVLRRLPVSDLVHGGPHDALQHDHRGRFALRPDRARCQKTVDYLRRPARAGARHARISCGGVRLEELHHRQPTRTTTAMWCWTPASMRADA
jgi:hypothetical protein